MKKLMILSLAIPTLIGAYEFTGYAPLATQRTTENVLYTEFPIYDQANRTEATLLQTQPMLDVKINTETENLSDRNTDNGQILREMRAGDPRFITRENVNLPLLPSTSSLRNPNLIK